MTNPDQTTREEYPLLLPIRTRWSDYDMLGHVNNVVCLRYFEIVVLHALEEAGLDWRRDPVIPYAAENLCRYHRPLGVARHIDAGYRVARLGTTSVTYALALFAPGEPTPAADGHFVHVFVDRESERPAPIPGSIRAWLAAREGAPAGG